MKSKSVYRILLLLLPVAIGLPSCSSTDCPLSNTVNMKANFYLSGTGAQTAVTDSMSVIAGGRINKTLFNRVTNVNTLLLPMGYLQRVDTLLFRFNTTAGSVTDSVFIGHTNEPHFVSLDCSTSFFHQITSATCTHRTPTEDFPTALDSILIINPSVSYDETENIQVFFSTF